MSGHSKWSTIKRKKGALDAKRGKMFTKLIKEISVAVREGGPDPEGNPRLRLAIQNAKGANMPKDNVERAIKKAAGEGGEAYVETTYEGYGPFGVAIYVETATDNTNRTVSTVRSLFSKSGGSLSTNGSLMFLFDRKGVFTFRTPEGQDEDEFTLELIDAGAEEVEFDEEYATVTCVMEDFGSVQKFLDDAGVEVENAELRRIPTTTKQLDDEELTKVMRLIEQLEDDDDVQQVYHNVEISDSQMASME
ncbi:MAG: YebC/PmpR family DNA-binding transcriptional regulator [Catalinimonas sp.]